MAEKISLRKQKKFRARQTILTAAAQQFKLHGFANTSIAGIMQAAGLGVGTFYNYFSSKEEVLLTLAKNLRARVEKSIAAAKKINQSSPELLEVCCVCTSKMIDENRFILPLFISASEHSDKPEQIPQSLSPGFRELFEEIILRGQEQGEFRADVPANIISEMIHSIYQTTAFSKLEISFQENIRLKIKILLDGIKTVDEKFFRSGDR
ncbi:MAG: TetR/AcrR family transcriptional regulator [Selenomonadaceae bacterium]|nr:TetR/AcrR family transcriptional regulator [Selenomonadaceae bacterium]